MKPFAEVSIRGKWCTVPALAFEDKTIVVVGRWLKVASVHDEEWLGTELRDPVGCLRALEEEKGRGMRADVFTFRQMLPDNAPRYGYPMEAESIAAIKVSTFQRWWDSLPQETRKNVRRAQKRGVEVRLGMFDEELVAAIASVNNESAVRQGRRFPHFGKSLAQVKKDYSSFLDCSDMLCAYHGRELIGFLKLVYRGQTASVLQLLVKLSHQDKRPANALLSKAVELCATKGVTHLTYGRFTYGNKTNSSLTQFKMRHGFEEVLIPRYYVPLTLAGAIYTHLRLYRGLLGLLPGSLVDLGLRFRLAWYRMSRDGIRSQ